MSRAAPGQERSWQRSDPHAPARVPDQRPGSRRITPTQRPSTRTQPTTGRRRVTAQPTVASPVGASVRGAAAQDPRARAGRHGRRPSLLSLLLSTLRRRRPRRH